jgi:hypothetical protein
VELPQLSIFIWKKIKRGHRMIACHRTRLAQQLVQALQGKALLGDAHNGLFLAAPRRTGKSTFLQGDLAPALPKRPA